MSYCMESIWLVPGTQWIPRKEQSLFLGFCRWCQRTHLPMQIDVRDVGSILGSGRSPRRRNDNPRQYACLENPMDRGAWWAIVQGLQRIKHDWSDLAHMYTLFPNRSPISEFAKHCSAEKQAKLTLWPAWSCQTHGFWRCPWYDPTILAPQC